MVPSPKKTASTSTSTQRRRKPNPKKTREKILKAAVTLFSKNGFAGTSVDSIARKAGVPHGLVFHYFQNKRTLWNQSKQLAYFSADDLSRIIPDTSLKLESFIITLMKNMISFYKENPMIMRMISWQRLEGRNPTDLSSSLSYQSWTKSLKTYKSNGQIKDDISVHHLAFLILSICNTAVTERDVFFKTDQDHEEYIQFISRGIIQMIHN